MSGNSPGASGEEVKGSATTQQGASDGELESKASDPNTTVEPVPGEQTAAGSATGTTPEDAGAPGVVLDQKAASTRTDTRM